MIHAFRSLYKLPRTDGRRKGTVLLVVVVIVMLLSLAAYQYMLSMETENMAAAINGHRIQAQQSANSARDLLQLMLEKPRAWRDRLGGLQDNPKLFAGDISALTEGIASATTSSAMANGIELPRFGVIAYALPKQNATALTSYGESSLLRPTRNTQSTTTPDSMLRPPTRYGARNESDKLHLYKLLEWDQQYPGAAAEALMQLPGMDNETADALMDWIDRDDEARPNGAESEFYSTLTRPLSPRNGLITDLDELLFVKGVTPLLLFGTETVRPMDETQMNPQPRAVTNLAATDELPRPWIELLTVYSAERNESYTGRRRINLNSTDLQDLHSRMLKVVPTEWANFIVLYRQYGGESASEELSAEKSIEQPATIDFAIPAEFPIRSRFDLIGAVVSIPSTESEDEEVNIVSPMSFEVAQAELVDWFDNTTLYPEQRIVGRVNVNNAPRQVLSALPGMDDRVVAAIMAARDTEGVELASRQHPIWLLTEGLVDAAMMQQLLPHLTCGGDVYRAEIWGQLDNRSAMVRFETILDASEGRCRPVYYRERSAPKDEITIMTQEEMASAGVTSTSATNDSTDSTDRPYAR